MEELAAGFGGVSVVARAAALVQARSGGGGGIRRNSALGRATPGLAVMVTRRRGLSGDDFGVDSGGRQRERLRHGSRSKRASRGNYLRGSGRSVGARTSKDSAAVSARVMARVWLGLGLGHGLRLRKKKRERERLGRERGDGPRGRLGFSVIINFLFYFSISITTPN